MKVARSLVLIVLASCVSGAGFCQRSLRSETGAAGPSFAADASDNSQAHRRIRISLPPISVTTGLVHLVVTVTDKRREFHHRSRPERFQGARERNPAGHSFFWPRNGSAAAHRLVAGHIEQHSPAPHLRAGSGHRLPEQSDPPQQGHGVSDDFRQRAGSGAGFHRRSGACSPTPFTTSAPAAERR